MNNETLTDVRVPSSLKKIITGPAKFDRGQTWFHFEQPVDKQLNGHAEAMKRWFHQTSKLVLDMGEK